MENKKYKKRQTNQEITKAKDTKLFNQQHVTYILKKEKE